MKKIVSVKNSAEAHLLVETLQQEGIAASVQGEWGSLEDPSIWIDNDADFERANVLIAEMTAKHRPSPTIERRRTHSRAFVGGLVVGSLLGAGVTTVVTTRLSQSAAKMSRPTPGTETETARRTRGPATTQRDDWSSPWRIAISMGRQTPG